MMRLAGAALVCTLFLGCAEDEWLPPQMPVPVGDTPPPAPAVADSFDAYVARDVATRPRPRLTHSLSLGYVGNEPLSGGVMRDTPMAPPYAYYPTPEDPQPRVCACSR